MPTYLLLPQTGSWLPYFIQSITLEGSDSGYVQFEEITTPELAKRFSGKEFALPENEAGILFKPTKDELAFLVGYQVHDIVYGIVGQVQSIYETAAHPLLEIVNADSGKEFMVPLTDEFIVELKKKERTLMMQLPDGLLEI